MKVAVCISGHLRDGDRICYPSLKEFILDKYDCDTFVSSWKEPGLGISYSNEDRQQDKITGETNDMTERILAAYRPLKYNIEDSSVEWIGELKKKWDGIFTRNGARLYSNNSMFKKIYDADLLRRSHQAETGTKYDVVIRIRPDLEFLYDVLELTLHEIWNGKLVAKNGYNGYHDQVFWGNEGVMTKASDCFLHVDKIVTSTNSTSFENAESIMARYFSTSQIPIAVRDDINFRYSTMLRMQVI